MARVREADPNTAAPTVGPTSEPEAPKMPTVDEMLASVGVNNVALQAEIGRLLIRFPTGIPQQLLFDTINNAVSTQALLMKIGELMVAAKKFSQTGKGPVGHASAEVV